jgi:hypothetical protein
MAGGQAVTAGTLGAWLLKADPAGGAVDRMAANAYRDVLTRCVRPSYRAALVAPGQPVLLWVSGRDPRYPSGIHAAGHTTGPVEDSHDGPVMPVRLDAVTPYVPRAALLADPRLAGIEVLRMAAGSNPSYLDAVQYAALCELFPQVDRRDGPSAQTA